MFAPGNFLKNLFEAKVEDLVEEVELDQLDEDEEFEEGYKVGDYVNATNPRSKPRYKIIGKTKTHYHLKDVDGREMHLPKKRIARVNKERFDSLRAKVAPAHLKGEDIPKHSKVNEEAEQLDEISKQTAKSYLDKSAASQDELARKSKYHRSKELDSKIEGDREGVSYHSKKADAADHKSVKRIKGASRALKRLTKEQLDYAIEHFEELDEVSKKTLGSYIKKASSNSTQLGAKLANAKDDLEKRIEIGGKIYKRREGISKAVNRLTKEEVEAIEETLAQLTEVNHALPHPYRSDLHKYANVNGGVAVYRHTMGSHKDKPEKMGHVGTTNGAGKYTAHDEHGKQISDNHHDIHGALKSIAAHHIKNGNGKKWHLE